MSKQIIFDKGGSASTINGILKDDYVRSEIRDAINRSTELLNRVKAVQTTHGRQFIFPVQFGVSQGVGARGENVALPAPGFGEYKQAFGNVKSLYASMYITGQAMAATQGNKAAFADALKRGLKDAQDGLKLDIQRQVYGDGTGAIAKVATTAASTTTIAVTDPYALSYVQADLDNAEKTRLFKRGMSLFIGTDNAYTKVTGVNTDGTITVSPAVSVTAGSVIYRGDSASVGNSKDNEVTGLAGLVKATGTYLGIDRSGLPEWQGNLIQVGTGTGGALTEEALRIAMDTAEINGTGEPELLLTNHKTRRRFEGRLQAQKRFVAPTKLEGGSTVLEFDGKPLVTDKDAPPQRLWALRTADIQWMMMADVDWMDKDGEVLSRVDERDAYKATLYTYRELVTVAPANQTVIYDITS